MAHCRHLRTGLVSVTFRSMHPLEIIDECIAADLETIEWGGDAHVPPGDLVNADAVGRTTRAAGLEIAAYGSYYRFGDVLDFEGPDPEAVLETASALRAPLVRVWAGRSGSRETELEDRNRLVDSARRLGQRAADLGLSIAFEYHRNTLTDTVGSAIRLIRAIDHPSVGMLWQPRHGDSPEACSDQLTSVLPYLYHVHCFHWGTAGSNDKRQLSEGGDRWVSYLETLCEHARKTGTTIPILLEFLPEDTPEDLRRDAATLNSWVAQVKA